MMKNIVRFSFFICVALLQFGCDDKEELRKDKEFRNGLAINTFISSIHTPPVRKSETIDERKGTPIVSYIIRDGKPYTCVSEPREITAYFNDIVSFSPNEGVLYPGAILQGATIDGNTLTGLNVARRPGILTISNIHFADSTKTYSVKLDTVTFPNYNDVLRLNFLNRTPQGAQVGRITYSKSEAHSLEQSFIKLGLSAKWASNSVKASLSKGFERQSNRLLVRLNQAYFDISFIPSPEAGADTVISPASFFRPDVTLTALKSVYQDTNDNPLVYVKSVTYGRIFLLLIESDSSMDELNASVDAAFRAWGGKTEANMSTEQKKVFESSKINVLSLGTSADATFGVLTGDNIQGLNTYLTSGANYSKKSPGWPISYVAKYLKNDNVSSLVDYNNYSIPTCTANPFPVNSLRVEFLGINDDKDATEPIKFLVKKGAIEVAKAEVGANLQWPSGSDNGVDLPINGQINEAEKSTVVINIDKSNANGGGCGQGAGFSWHTLRVTATMSDGSKQVWYDIPAQWYIGNCHDKAFSITIPK